MFSRSGLGLLLLCASLGQFLQWNPMWFGKSAGPVPPDSVFHVFTEQRLLDDVLDRHAEEIGSDFVPYRNHCLRVLSFAVYHLGGKSNVSNEQLDIMGLALAYHDIALWTKGELNYLEPSAADLEKEMESVAGMALEFDIYRRHKSTLRRIITEHHKLTDWRALPLVHEGVDEDLVNAVRKGDWADATIGLVRFGLPASYLEKAYAEVPESGFHMILAGMSARLSPDSILGRLAVLRIFKL